MDALPPDLRKRLERAVREARMLAEAGAKQAVEALAVDRARPHDAMDEAQKALRAALRAHGRQLGDVLDAQRGVQEIRRLVREVAYQHWHRMLFARFLAENDLLIEPVSGVAVTLAECEELARDRGADPWALASSFAERLLPQIFRRDDPALRVPLSPETRQSLERLLAALPQEVFAAGDALGWTYQFWQAAEKDAVNARVKSGEKITGETLPAVTQLFTEPYMVQFLLDNTIGAWHAAKVLAQRPDLAASAASEQELREASALPGYAFEYLRFVRETRDGDPDGAPTGPWRPAAGTYPGWPGHAREITVLDPCCGSGHFLVAALELLMRLRMLEEGMPMETAIRAVLSENLFGLELDQRCTQIAAFYLGLAAWKCAGHVVDLPSIHVACSGLGPNATKEEWLALAEQAAAKGGMPAKGDFFQSDDSLLSAPLKEGLTALYDVFMLAPELGSLIDPRARAGDMFTAGFEAIGPVLARMLDVKFRDEETHERAVAAHGMARAAQILTGTYTLVVTNVPYLGRGSQSELLKEFAESHHDEAKNDLATVFVSRMLRWIRSGEQQGTVAAVTPQNWLLLTSYKRFRSRLLKERSWSLVARLGSGAFETIGGHVVNVALLSVSGGKPLPMQAVAGIDVSAASPPSAKASLLRGEETSVRSEGGASAGAAPANASVGDAGTGSATVPSAANADGRVRLVPQANLHSSSLRTTLGDFAECAQGLSSGDDDRWCRQFWEVGADLTRWERLQRPSHGGGLFAGRHQVIDARFVHGTDHTGVIRGRSVWGKTGVAVNRVGRLAQAAYSGDLFHSLCPVIVAKRAEHELAVLTYALSPEFVKTVEGLGLGLNLSNGHLGQVEFDPPYWGRVAAETYPGGFPSPYSDDPVQWLFHGHPASAENHAVLQVAVARLLGYRWPAEVDTAMRLATKARVLVERCKALDDFADSVGIVCLPSVRGEATGVDRLRALLGRAFGVAWSAAREHDLLNAASESLGGARVQPTLEAWLRERFFVEHCALFHDRPFIWHVWDGRDDGFHALVNYHRLAGKDGEGRRTLEALAFTYLGEWIDRQRQHAAAGEEGADGRLAAALALQGELQKILEGEPPYDVFVRWKPLHEQPVGWGPDVDDGVRLNIRPFLLAKDVRAKGAGILRAKPDNTWSNMKKPGVGDRGKEPERLRPRESFPWFWGCDPDAHAEHRIDFGAGTPGSAPAGEAYTGVRWNGLHYTRAAKAAARGRQP